MTLSSESLEQTLQQTIGEMKTTLKETEKNADETVKNLRQTVTDQEKSLLASQETLDSIQSALNSEKNSREELQKEADSERENLMTQIQELRDNINDIETEGSVSQDALKETVTALEQSKQEQISLEEKKIELENTVEVLTLKMETQKRHLDEQGNKICDLDQHLNDREGEIERMQIELDEVEEGLSNSQRNMHSELASKEHEINLLRDEMSDVREVRELRDEEIMKLKDELEEKNTEMESQNEKHALYKQTSEKAMLELKNELDETSITVTESDMKVIGLNGQIHQLSSEVEETRSELQRQAEQLENVKFSLEEARSDLSQAKSTHVELELKISGLDGDKFQLVADLEESRELVQRRLDHSDDLENRLQEEITELKKENHRLRDGYSEVLANCERVNYMVEDLQTRLEVREGELEKWIEKHEGEHAEHETVVRDLERQLAFKEEALETQQQRIQALEESRDGEKGCFFETIAEQDEEMSKLKEAHTTEVDLLQKQLEILRDEHAHLVEVEAEKVAAEHTRLQKHLSDQEEKVVSLVGELQDSNEKIIKLQADMTEATTLIECHEETAQKAKQLHNESDAKVRAAKDRIDALQAELRQMHDSIMKADKDFSEVRAELEYQLQNQAEKVIKLEHDLESTQRKAQ